jgi:hypothetical protein
LLFCSSSKIFANGLLKFTASDHHSGIFTAPDYHSGIFTAPDYHSGIFTASDYHSGIFTASDYHSGVFTAPDYHSDIFRQLFLVWVSNLSAVKDLRNFIQDTCCVHQIAYQRFYSTEQYMYAIF